MRALILICTFFITGCATSARDVKVFIAPRSSIVPSSGKVVLDVYWYNAAEAPKQIPNMESYSVSALINSRSDKTLGRALGGARIVDHPGQDRVIPARTMLHDQIAQEMKLTGDEFAEVSAEFSVFGVAPSRATRLY